MTADQAGPAPQMSASPYPRWKAERITPGRVDLTVWTGPGEPAVLPMGNEEAFALVRGIDRVSSWAAADAEGVLGQSFATPEEVRRQLSINGYVVTSPGIDEHTRLVAATPWASWVEEVPSARAGQVSWFVNVFAPDDGQFRQETMAHGSSLEASGFPGGCGG